MADKVFVSPGVYTSERDLTFVTRQVGVTTLGLVGETTKGPAFQPIFVTNYDEFRSFFGGQNASLVKDTGFPQYELPYIAKSYLSQSNQLFVTRVLGFSGYDAGYSWAITLQGALDPSTSGLTTTSNLNPYFEFTSTTGGTITIVSTDSLTQQLFDNGNLDGLLNPLLYSTVSTGTTGTTSVQYIKTGSSFSGVSSTYKVISTGSTTGAITGITSGVTTYYSGTSYSDVENKVVVLLRSRAAYTIEDLIFQVTGGTTPIGFSTTSTAANTNPLGDFALTGISLTQGTFTYDVSFDQTKKNYITRVLGRGAQDGKTAVFVEEFFDKMFDKDVDDSKVYGINVTNLATYSRVFDDYKQEYSPAVTPYVVSELRGNKVLRLFRLWTISDGSTANEEIKISITNIKLDDREFDIVVRSFYDTDANPVILEQFTRCSMNPSSNNFVARKVGTLDGTYPSRSTYILLELDETVDTSDAFPAGFVGFPVRDYTLNSNTSLLTPNILYKETYTAFENKRKAYLGLSNIVGIDADFFDYKGVPDISGLDMWTGLTKGFHMDIDATGATIDGINITINSSGGTYSPIFLFDTGNAPFRTDAGVANTDYEKIFARKFTLAPYGGFDGWDVYRTRRTNLDSYLINGTRGVAGLTSGAFENKTLSDGSLGITSDYYAFLEAIWTFRNPEAVNVNVLATPGIDTFNNSNLVEETIEMVEQDRADSVYIVTTPDVDASGVVLTAESVADELDGLYDSSYTATYWPWIQINDTENNVYIYVPPTRDVVRNIALTDNISFPWFAVAGIQRGDVDAIKARKKLTLSERDTLYENRINPIATFTSEGIKIFGNKTMQVNDTALNRLNVRRLLLQARTLISAVGLRLLFEQNDSVVRNQFLSLVNPILDNIRSERGLVDFRVVLSNDPEEIDRNTLSGKIYLKPTRSLEFIQIEFTVLPTGASFDNI